ncbi:MAG: protein kinase [Prevotellaceae bacterium]|nr:protein kinase [Prevotellaceae bacterium]
MENDFRDCLRIGTTLKGRSYQYTIERVLGQGSFGITYLATVRIEGALGALDLNVAVKEFFMHDINGRNGTSVTSVSQHGLFEEYKKKFIREANNLSKLRHPNIVKVLESFEANGTVYYSMEYIAGSSLDDRLVSSGKLSEVEAVDFAREICSALQFMHSNGMLHLDLKPQNVMARFGHAVLVDFGLAKHYDGNGQPETCTKVGVGTMGFVPVEQAGYHEGQGFPATIDVYALGATIYNMLTGCRPPEASLKLKGSFPIAKLRKVGVSEWLVSLVAKCMNPMPNGRYQSVAEVLSVLESNSPQNDIKVEAVYPPDSNKTELSKLSAPKPKANFINGHEYVDLGLSVKWATCSVGANTPSDYGDHFAWGESRAKSKYIASNSVTYTMMDMPDIAGDEIYDAARANWGSSWRLPTASEIDELIEKCQRTWTNVDGHKGYMVTGPNGNSIFFPATGFRHKAAIFSDEYVGGYWSSTPCVERTSCAYILHFSSSYFERCILRRYYGHSVRPVSD